MSPIHPLILVVDDDPDVRGAFTHALRCKGFRVAEAHDGREGLSLLYAGLRPALILLDQRMPILDGLGFRLEQLTDEELARIPVLLMTAETTIGDLVQQMRPAGVVQKPVGLAPFLAAVQMVLGREQHAAAAL